MSKPWPEHMRPGWQVASGFTTVVRLSLLLALALPAPAARAQEGHGAEHPRDLLEPRFSLHGFADVTFTSEWYSNTDSSPSSTSGFAIGQFDLYIASRLAENLSFLGESVFEFIGGGWIVDVERVLLKYSWADYLNLTVGRGHTALGYWNEAYHHGSLLYPTVDRPEALKFEDDGGVLPVHFVGMELSGTVPVAPRWRLGYVANLANGRGPIQDFIQSGGDINSNKAVALKLSLTREAGRTLRIGPSIYYDVIPPNPEIPGREGSIDGTILGAHLVYEDRHVQLLSEAYAMRNDYRNSRERFDHAAWYAVLVARLGMWNPYIGIDGVDFESGDLFFPEEFGDLTRYLGGVRFDVNAFNAVKLEFRHDRRPDQTINALALQTAFTF
ncbi:MAG: hypothetical protein M3373_12765 [Gemmatimonadota bacterium]|nr:hypothetical protein [Gemmatimonadota bacterium]